MLAISAMSPTVQAIFFLVAVVFFVLAATPLLPGKNNLIAVGLAAFASSSCGTHSRLGEQPAHSGPTGFRAHINNESGEADHEAGTRTVVFVETCARDHSGKT